MLSVVNLHSLKVFFNLLIFTTLVMLFPICSIHRKLSNFQDKKTKIHKFNLILCNIPRPLSDTDSIIWYLIWCATFAWIDSQLTAYNLWSQKKNLPNSKKIYFETSSPSASNFTPKKTANNLVMFHLKPRVCMALVRLDSARLSALQKWKKTVSRDTALELDEETCAWQNFKRTMSPTWNFATKLKREESIARLKHNPQNYSCPNHSPRNIYRKC